jgi:hypothetical protein
MAIIDNRGQVFGSKITNKSLERAQREGYTYSPVRKGDRDMFAIVLLAFVAGMCCGTIAIGLAMAARD